MSKSRRSRCSRLVPQIEKGRNAFKIITDKFTCKRPHKHLGIDEEIILN
jgi:hypothetical protein